MLSRARDLEYPGVRKNGLGYFCFFPGKVANAVLQVLQSLLPKHFFIRSKGKRIEGVFCFGAANVSMSNTRVKCLWDWALIPQVFYDSYSKILELYYRILKTCSHRK